MAVKQCPHPDLSGYNTVEIVLHYCEVGQGCEGLKAECPYAWADNDKRATRAANRVYADFCKRLEARPY